MDRGDRQERIFLDDVDRQDWLKTLAEACRKTGWQTHACGLMSNHFHLVFETPNANLVEGMRWLPSTYTLRLNQRPKLLGHVFSGRYKALLVESRGNGYLRIAGRLQLGTPKSNRALLHHWMQRPPTPAKPQLCAQLRFQPIV